MARSIKVMVPAPVVVFRPESQRLSLRGNRLRSALASRPRALRPTTAKERVMIGPDLALNELEGKFMPTINTHFLTAHEEEARPRKTALLVVAHPDDETLFAGGTVFLHPEWDWHVVSLCRASDPDRRPRFHTAMTRLGMRTATMGDSDDEPEQVPLTDVAVEDSIVSLLPKNHFDLVITHALGGEYTRHLRHEEVSRAVVALWQSRRLVCDQLWMFAYADSGRGTYPVALPDAHFIVPLPVWTLDSKRTVLSAAYNFGPNSWESLAMPTREAFWCFDEPGEVGSWRQQQLLQSASNTVIDWGNFQ